MHFVFAVKHREALIIPEFRDRLHQYIYTMLKNRKQHPFSVNGTEDHIHIFTGLSPSVNMPDLIREIKTNSSKFINDNRLSKKRFHWQAGYGVFSYGRSQRDQVIRYIMNQQEHHRNRTFRVEYLELLDKMEVPYDEQYLFEFFT